MILASFALAAAVLIAAPAAAPRARGPSGPLDLRTRWTGDLDGMIKRRVIRALVVYSKTFYFLDRGTQRGTSYDTLRAFEDDLNRRLGRGTLGVNVVFIPVGRDEILPGLREGRGDIAVANLTITPARRLEVDFSEPVETGVAEVPVTGPRAAPLQGPEDLGGREVFVRRSSSYHESLTRLNAELEKAGKPLVRLRPAPEELEDEDLLEMVNAGLVQTVIVDSHKAAFWAQIFPALVLHRDAAVRTDGEVGWAFRHGSPGLRDAVNRFVGTHRVGTAFGNEVLHRYLKNTRWVRNAAHPEELEKFRRAVGLFRQYGDRYGFDHLLLTAQGYQESHLDQSRRSPRGAVGIMQVLPSTGQDMGVGDVREIEPNIHAGVKYLRLIRRGHFDEEAIDPINRTLLAFAAYNAGPTKVSGLRREAARAGLNPNVWFNHVEVVAAQRIGRETVQYVSNIYKYYVAYRLVEEEREAREQAREAVEHR